MQVEVEVIRMQLKGDDGRRPNGGVVEESQNMNCLGIDRRKRCTIGLELAEDMIVAGIVRNVLRKGITEFTA